MAALGENLRDLSGQTLVTITPRRGSSRILCKLVAGKVRYSLLNTGSCL